jgi:RNA polymerase-binding transcription factor DksA
MIANITDYTDICRVLEQERAEILRQSDYLARDAAAIVESQRRGEHRLEGSVEGDSLAVSMGMVMSLQYTTATHLAEIEHALERIAAGTYGICESCGQEIALGRLQARPKSTRCTGCASRR